METKRISYTTSGHLDELRDQFLNQLQLEFDDIDDLQVTFKDDYALYFRAYGYSYIFYFKGYSQSYSGGCFFQFEHIIQQYNPIKFRMDNVEQEKIFQVEVRPASGSSYYMYFLERHSLNGSNDAKSFTAILKYILQHPHAYDFDSGSLQ